MKKTLAIIGTAGRGEDASKLTVKHWNAMCDTAIKICEDEFITDLVSGAAAWSDHVAVRISSHLGLPIKLWLPAVTRDLETALYYHRKFSAVLKRDTFNELRPLIAAGCTENFGGFKDRNTKVADAADLFLACTFGNGSQVKDGGTLDTVNKMQKRGISGYHLDLNTLRLWKI